MLNKTITSFKDEAGHLSILMLPKLPILKDYKGLNGQPLPQPGQPCPQPGQPCWEFSHNVNNGWITPKEKWKDKTPFDSKSSP